MADLPNYDETSADGIEKVKIICLGDSAVGKSKWVTWLNKITEEFLVA